MKGHSTKSAPSGWRRTSAGGLVRVRVNPLPLTDDELLACPVPIARVFSFGHQFGERVHNNIVQLESDIAVGRVVLGRYLLPPMSAAIQPRLFSGRTDEHRELCARSATWLDSVGCGWGASLAYPGGYADVMAADRTVAVECGYTNAWKVLTALDCDMGVAVVPYAHKVALPREVVFLFTAGRGLL